MQIYPKYGHIYILFTSRAYEYLLFGSRCERYYMQAHIAIVKCTLLKYRFWLFFFSRIVRYIDGDIISAEKMIEWFHDIILPIHDFLGYLSQKSHYLFIVQNNRGAMIWYLCGSYLKWHKKCESFRWCILWIT